MRKTESDINKFKHHHHTSKKSKSNETISCPPTCTRHDFPLSFANQTATKISDSDGNKTSYSTKFEYQSLSIHIVHPHAERQKFLAPSSTRTSSLDFYFRIFMNGAETQQTTARHRLNECVKSKFQCARLASVLVMVMRIVISIIIGILLHSNRRAPASTSIKLLDLPTTRRTVTHSSGLIRISLACGRLAKMCFPPLSLSAQHFVMTQFFSFFLSSTKAEKTRQIAKVDGTSQRKFHYGLHGRFSFLSFLRFFTVGTSPRVVVLSEP